MNAPVSSAAQIIARARAEGRTSLDEASGKALLGSFGIRTPRSALARDAKDAERQAHGLTRPLVAKVVSPQLLHTQIGSATCRASEVQCGSIRVAHHTCKQNHNQHQQP